MKKQDLLNIINADNMSKKEVMEFLLQLKLDIVPLKYNFYQLEDGYYKGYDSNYLGYHNEKLSDEDSETYLSVIELREAFYIGKLTYANGWIYKF